MSSAALQPLPPADQALFLAITTPPDILPADFRPSDAPDSIQQAAFLSRPDIQPHLQALTALAAFRDQIRANHLTHQAAEILLDVARNTDDLVEKRRAATAVLKIAQFLLAAQRKARTAADATPTRERGPDRANGAASHSDLSERTDVSATVPAQHEPSDSTGCAVPVPEARSSPPIDSTRESSEPNAAPQITAQSEAHARAGRDAMRLSRSPGRRNQDVRKTDRADRAQSAQRANRRSRVQALAGAAGALTSLDSS